MLVKGATDENVTAQYIAMRALSFNHIISTAFYWEVDVKMENILDILVIWMDDIIWLKYHISPSLICFDKDIKKSEGSVCEFKRMNLKFTNLQEAR